MDMELIMRRLSTLQGIAERLGDIRDADRRTDRPTAPMDCALQDIGWHRQARKTAAEEIAAIADDIETALTGQ